MKILKLEGRKFKKRYIVIKVDNFWWVFNENKWVESTEFTHNNACNCFSYCRSIKAFKRRLKQWNYLPKGTEVSLIGKYRGQGAVYFTKGPK
jgi:hypothetical protein